MHVLPRLLQHGRHCWKVMTPETSPVNLSTDSSPGQHTVPPCSPGRDARHLFSWATCHPGPTLMVRSSVVKYFIDSQNLDSLTYFQYV